MEDLKRGGGGKEIGILMDTIFKRNLFWGKVSLGPGTECEEGEGGISPYQFLS